MVTCEEEPLVRVVEDHVLGRVPRRGEHLQRAVREADLLGVREPVVRLGVALPRRVVRRGSDLLREIAGAVSHEQRDALLDRVLIGVEHQRERLPLPSPSVDSTPCCSRSSTAIV